MIADQGSTPSNLSPSEATWPDCSAVQGVCLAYDMGRFLGRGVLSGLLDFIFGAKDGARLSLQRNRSGFTLQVTEAMQRADDEPVALADVRALRLRLDPLTKGVR